MEERIKDSLEEIKKELAAIEATIQQLPEIQAATLLATLNKGTQAIV